MIVNQSAQSKKWWSPSVLLSRRIKSDQLHRIISVASHLPHRCISAETKSFRCCPWSYPSQPAPDIISSSLCHSSLAVHAVFLVHIVLSQNRFVFNIFPRRLLALFSLHCWQCIHLLETCCYEAQTGRASSDSKNLNTFVCISIKQIGIHIYVNLHALIFLSSMFHVCLRKYIPYLLLVVSLSSAELCSHFLHPETFSTH